MTDTTKTVKKEWPVLQMEGRGKLIIRENVKKKIDILHRAFGNLEWCGVVFYNKLEGSISDPSTYVAEVVDIYPMDKGSHSYTETVNTGDEIEKMSERVDSYWTSRTGYVHSHHNMRAYFSGEDLDELHTNVENYSKNGSYYLSLIVNFKEEYVAKIVKLVQVPETNIVIEEEDTEAGSIKTISKQMMFMMDLDIEIEHTIEEDEELMKRIAELEEQSKAKQVVKKPTHQTINGRQYPIVKPSEAKDEWTLFNNDGRYGEEVWEEPYMINPTTIKKNLNQILTLDSDNKRETGQVLASIYKMSFKEQDDLYDDIEINIHLMTIDMFGYDKLTEALQETKKALNDFSHVTLWKDVLSDINEIFDEAIEYSQYAITE